MKKNWLYTRVNTTDIYIYRHDRIGYRVKYKLMKIYIVLRVSTDRKVKICE